MSALDQILGYGGAIAATAMWTVDAANLDVNRNAPDREKFVTEMSCPLTEGLVISGISLLIYGLSRTSFMERLQRSRSKGS